MLVYLETEHHRHFSLGYIYHAESDYKKCLHFYLNLYSCWTPVPTEYSCYKIFLMGQVFVLDLLCTYFSIHFILVLSGNLCEIRGNKMLMTILDLQYTCTLLGMDTPASKASARCTHINKISCTVQATAAVYRSALSLFFVPLLLLVCLS